MALRDEKYRVGPAGIAVHPWLNKPDTKFNADGVYKTGQRLSGAEAAKLKEQVDGWVEEAYEEFTQDLPAKDKKKWGKYYPYETDEDDDGHPTGDIVFRYKQNAVIKLKDGDRKAIHVGLYDPADKETHVDVYGGSTIRVMFKPRPTGRIASNHQIGVTLTMCAVQVVKLAEGGHRDTGGFGSVGEGFSEEPMEAAEDETAMGATGGEDTAGSDF